MLANLYILCYNTSMDSIESKSIHENIISLDLARKRRQNELHPQAQQSLGRTATVASIEEHRRQVEIDNDKELFYNTFKLCIQSLEASEDPNQTLDQVDQTLETLHDVISDSDRELLASSLLFHINKCHPNIAKLAIGYPNILKLIGAAINSTGHHPVEKATRQRAIKALSHLPGDYSFTSGDYTPPAAT